LNPENAEENQDTEAGKTGDSENISSIYL